MLILTEDNFDKLKSYIEIEFYKIENNSLKETIKILEENTFKKMLYNKIFSFISLFREPIALFIAFSILIILNYFNLLTK